MILECDFSSDLNLERLCERGTGRSYVRFAHQSKVCVHCFTRDCNAYQSRTERAIATGRHQSGPVPLCKLRLRARTKFPYYAAVKVRVRLDETQREREARLDRFVSTS